MVTKLSFVVKKEQVRVVCRITFRYNRKSLAEEFVDTRIAGWDYQLMAIRSILEAIESRKERFLWVLATETILKQAEKIAEELTGN